jgi:20S proteasome alpha/beta subunit
MTLIVAVAFANGVVVASDSAASDTDTNLKQDVIKVRPLEGCSMLLGISGASGTTQHIEEAFVGFHAKETLKRLRQDVKKIIATELREAYDGYVQVPGTQVNPPVAVVLLAGLCENRPFILEIDRDGQDTVYGEGLGSFLAVGSGKAIAQAIFRPHLAPASARSEEQAKVLACRVIEDAIALSAAFVAAPVHLHLVTLGGQSKECSKEELEGLSDTCAAWRQLERDTLSRALAPAGTAEEQSEIPRP